MINGKYHIELTGKQNTVKRPIVIDACRLESGKYEVMVMYRSNGREIEYKTTDKVENAVQIYNEYLQKYTA